MVSLMQGLHWDGIGRALEPRKKPHEHVAYVLLGGKRGVLSHQADSRLRGQHQAFLNRRIKKHSYLAGPQYICASREQDSDNEACSWKITKLPVVAADLSGFAKTCSANWAALPSYAWELEGEQPIFSYWLLEWLDYFSKLPNNVHPQLNMLPLL